MGDAAVGADVADPSEVDVDGLLSPLRYRLDDEAIERYRMVGADTMAAVDAAGADAHWAEVLTGYCLSDEG